MTPARAFLGARAVPPGDSLQVLDPISNPDICADTGKCGQADVAARTDQVAASSAKRRCQRSHMKD